MARGDPPSVSACAQGKHLLTEALERLERVLGENSLWGG